MEGGKGGAKEGCGSTSDNLMIDIMVTMDCHRGKRNLSMAWIGVKKAYDSVECKWLCDIMEVHRFSYWLCRVIRHLVPSWNTKIMAVTH